MAGRILSKPFELDEVSALVRRVLAENEKSPPPAGEGSNGR